MKYKISFHLEHPLELPSSYNHVLQGALYNWLNDDNYQMFLHDTGYIKENRQFKLFCYSKIYGEYKINHREHLITFDHDIYFYISSYDTKFISYLGENVISQQPLNLKGRLLLPTSFETIEEDYGTECIVQTLSPITIYSTMTNLQGEKRVYYYSPYEKEFSELIRKNLLHKYEAYHGESPAGQDFCIEPANYNCKESVLFYKSIVIKAWNGRFHIKGSKELMDVAINCGLGSKNSQGFGCIIVHKK